jgi:hypothetical protein
MSLFALSFDRLDISGGTRTEILKFVPIGIEQARGNYTVDEIPEGSTGQIVEVNSPNSQYKTPFKIVGANQFRSLTVDELKKYIEDKAGFGVPPGN